MFATVVALISAIGSVVLRTLWPLQVVGPDQEAIKCRRGRVLLDSKGKARVWKSGLVLIVPGIHTLMRCRVLPSHFDWEAQLVRTNEDLIYRVGMSLYFEVVSPRDFLLGIDVIESALRTRCYDGLIKYLSSPEHVDLNNLAEIQVKLAELLAPEFAAVGLGQRAVASDIERKNPAVAEKFGFAEIVFGVFEPDAPTAHFLRAETAIERAKAIHTGDTHISIAEVLAAQGCSVMLNASSMAEMPSRNGTDRHGTHSTQ